MTAKYKIIRDHPEGGEVIHAYGFDTLEAAAAELERLNEIKLNKGYRIIGYSSLATRRPGA